MAGTTGIVLMMGGLIFTILNTSPEGGDLVSIIFGSATTFTGFITRSVQSRKIISGQREDMDNEKTNVIYQL